jgi:hypothetical protein
MDFNQIRLAFNLFFKPLMLFLVSLLAMNLIEVAAMQPMLVPLTKIASYGIIGVLLLASYLLAQSVWLLVRVARGIGESCHGCGMPVRYVSRGRYGPYYRCMACGANRRSHE